VSFGGLTALSDVSLELAPGEILGLIGPNGAGKSTMINVLSGFQQPNGGRIKIDDQDITRLPPYKRARQGIARTFQAARIFGNRSVRENVAVPALATGTSAAQTAERVDDILTWFGLSHLADRPGNALAYADERRVGIARALAGRPSYLMMDEPAAGMSEADAVDLIDKIKQMPSRFGCGVLLVEHNINLVFSSCARVAVLNFGQSLAQGTPQEVAERADVIAAYLGEAD